MTATPPTKDEQGRYPKGTRVAIGNKASDSASYFPAVQVVTLGEAHRGLNEEWVYEYSYSVNGGLFMGGHWCIGFGLRECHIIAFDNNDGTGKP